MDSINNACKFGSDAWLELQAFKTRQLNRREKLTRHKILHKDLIKGFDSQNQPQNGASLSPQSLNLAGTSRSQPYTTAVNQSSSSSNDNLEVKCQRNNSNLDKSLSIDPIGNTASIWFTLNNTTTFGVDDYNLNSDLEGNSINLKLVECLLLLKLCDVALKLPIDSRSLKRSISKIRGLEVTSQSLVENLLQKFAHQELITIEEPTNVSLRQNNQIIRANPKAVRDQDEESCIYVTSADHSKLVEFDKSFGSLESIKALLTESKSEDIDESDGPLNSTYTGFVPIQTVKTHSSSPSNNLGSSHSNDRDSSSDKLKKDPSNSSDYLGDNSAGLLRPGSTSNDQVKQTLNDDLESLLSLSSTRERESKKLGEELLELLSRPTAKERNLMERFRSADGYQVQEFCPKGTKGECIRHNKGANVCDKLHFKKIIAKHTEESLGDCSFLNTCFHMDSCKYVHYEVDYDKKKDQFKRPNPVEPQVSDRQSALLKHNQIIAVDDDNSSKLANSSSTYNYNYTLSPERQAKIDAKNRKRFKTVLYPPQWIQCDLRFFDMGLLGKFSVVMADPPWDIHMELPYGTMSDDEMRKLNIPALQDEGVIFLWVTGRAMELGRECLTLWGYERCDEIIWVKTNQLQRIIRTGRTGHWLNHGKEHCLVGVKGNPKDINRGLDCDVIVAEVRATSHKPDEIYGIIERLSPGTRKIELFGRAHNVQPNWITLGNQLNGVRLIEPNLVNAFKKLNLPFQTG